MARLSPDAELFDQRAIAREIGAAEVFEQAAAFSDQSKQPAARMMIFDVGLEMLGQLIDACAHQRDLNFGGTAIVGGSSVRLDNLALSSTC